MSFSTSPRRFGDTRALEDVTADPGGGERSTGCWASNGAGKSTLLNVLAGRLHAGAAAPSPWTGSRRTATPPWAKLFLAGGRQSVPGRHEGAAGVWTRRPCSTRTFDREYAEDLATQFGLPLDRQIDRLSTGYASIFRLALALSVNTPYVLFDEPVLGLDARHRDLFYKLLVQKYAENPSCTVVLSTHLIGRRRTSSSTRSSSEGAAFSGTRPRRN